MSLSRVAKFRPAALVIGALALVLTGSAQTQLAQLTTPAPSTTLTGSSVTFGWTAGTNVTQYFLYVGTAFAGNDLYSANQGAATTVMVNNLPTDGRILYVRLWSFVPDVGDVNFSWQSNDYQYLAFNSNTTCGALSRAAITSPTPSTTLTGASVTFQWSGNLCVTQYTLAVGTTGAGSTDIFGPSSGTSQSQLVGGLPTDGTTTVYVRLTSTIGGVTFFNDYTYTAFNGTNTCVTPASATLTGPSPGSTLAGASQTFAWNAGCGVDEFYLYVGSTFDGNDIFGQDEALNTSVMVNNLPVDGRALFVRLWSHYGGIWHFVDYTFVASGTASGCGLGLPAQLTAPAAGSTLTGASVTFTWTAGSCVTLYTLRVGNEQGGSELFGPTTFGTGTLSATVNSLPTDGRTLFVQLSSTINGVVTDQQYQFVASSTATGCGSPSGATMTSPAPGSAFTGPSVTFSWTAGCSVTEYFLYVGIAAGGNELYSQDQGTRQTVTVNNLPTNGQPLFVRLWSNFNGTWHFVDYTYTASGAASCTVPTAAVMISPVNGTMLTGSTVTFTWTPGSCVTQYTLSVGTSLGGSQISGPTSGTNQSLTVNNLPTNGTAVFVRLTSTLSGGNQSNDYTYTAFSSSTGCSVSSLATMASPVPGTTLPGSTVTFTWNAGCNASQYYLYVGTAMGLNDIYGASQGSSLSGQVTGLPTTVGQTLFVRLWTNLTVAGNGLNAGWNFIDYTYNGASGGGCVSPTAATISTPAPGSTLAGASVTFTATTGQCVSTYTLSVGTTSGASDLFLSGPAATSSWTVNNLPVDGSTVFVRVTSVFTTGGNPVNTDLTYTASGGAGGGGGGGGCGGTGLAGITAPAPGSTLTGATVTFNWSAGCSVYEYFLMVGTGGVGANNLYSQNQGTSLSGTVAGLPVDGSTLNVRLWTYLNVGTQSTSAGWHYIDYTYTAFH